MTRMNLHEVKAHLSKVARMVKHGETVILCERNKPIAEIHPLPGIGKARKRRLGLLKGMCPITDEFFKADAQIAASFNEGPVLPIVKDDS